VVESESSVPAVALAPEPSAPEEEEARTSGPSDSCTRYDTALPLNQEYELSHRTTQRTGAGSSSAMSVTVG
jgi:hypothetical protein